MKVMRRKLTTRNWNTKTIGEVESVYGELIIGFITTRLLDPKVSAVMLSGNAFRGDLGKKYHLTSIFK